MFYKRREVAAENGREVKSYSQRIKRRSDICLIEGCDNKTFCQNLCSIHYTEKRAKEGYKKPPKIKYFCTVEGCDRVRFKHKEGLCKNHYNQKYGITPVITGRPAKEKVACSICGNPGSPVTLKCQDCYMKEYRLKFPEKFTKKKTTT